MFYSKEFNQTRFDNMNDNYRRKAIEGNVKNRKTELSQNPPTFFNWYYP